MKFIWKPIGLIAGLIAVGAGTLMLMGNVHSADQRSAEIEFVKLKSMAAVWQSHIDGARSTLREQCMIQGLLDVSQSPGDWATWRAAQKYQSACENWNPIYGTPRGIALVLGNRQLHSFYGDSSGLASATAVLADEGDLYILPGNYNNDGCIAVQYMVSASSPENFGGRFIALIPRSSLLPTTNAPANWHLLANPEDSRFSSAPGAESSHVSVATWPLLLQQDHGMIPGNSGDQWGFAKIQIPGNGPLLLVGSLHKPLATKRSAAVAIILGALALGLTAFIPRNSRPNDPENSVGPSHAPETGPSQPSNNYREIFQSIPDPLCVIESDGRVERANHAAHALLNLKKGFPDSAIYFEHGDIQVQSGEFFKQAAAFPRENSGPCRLVSGDSILFSGHIVLQRLYADQYHHSPVLVQFHAEQEEESPTETTETFVIPQHLYEQGAVDLASPFPVIKVSGDGLIEHYNDAARAVCPQLESSPLISDALPALDGKEWSDLIKFSDTKSIESVFGSTTYEFRLVRREQCVFLYGHPAAETKKLEIALEQSQASFNALCNLTPAAVMLVDVHEHKILQCNMEACDLFSMPAPALVGNRLENLSAFPWELGSDPDQEYYALTPDGRTLRCSFGCELIKLDGEPTMLVVLNLITQTTNYIAPEPACDIAPVVNELQNAIIESVKGPGILIVSNPVVRDVARKLLARIGHDCEAFTSLDDATIWMFAHETTPNFITLDLTDFDGANEWLSDMRARFGPVPVLAITDEDLSENSSPEDAFILTKPFDLDTVEHALKELHVEPVLDDLA